MNKSIILLIITSIFIYSCNNQSSEKNKEETQKQKLTPNEIYSQKVNATCTILTDLGQGSGFFIDSNLVVTNYHVIANVKFAEVVLNNDSKKYNVIGTLAIDKINDLCLLLVDYNNKCIFNIERGIPNPGDHVFSISTPIGLTKTLSDGLISGKKNFDGRSLIQITVPISHGSSGCPIINEYGFVVGIAVGGIEEGNNLNFCIPTSYLLTLLEYKESYTTTLNTEPRQDEIVEQEKPKTIQNPSSQNNGSSNTNSSSKISFKNKYFVCKNNAARSLMIAWAKNREMLDYQINSSSFEVYEYEHSFKRPGWADSKCIKYIVTFEATNNEGTRYMEEAFNQYFEHTDSFSWNLDKRLCSNWNMKDNIPCD